MPTPDIQKHLSTLYAAADDPWNTHASAYEQGKFRTTVTYLPRPRYRCGLEVGCGAGALTAHLAARCDDLIAMDCTARALSAAKSRVGFPHVGFTHGTVPGDWPDRAPDLVVLSEVLYFLTDAESAGLASRIRRDTAPDCDIMLVNWLGDTGGAISGQQAADRLVDDLQDSCDRVIAQVFGRFRIDVLCKGSIPPTRRNSCGTTEQSACWS